MERTVTRIMRECGLKPEMYPDELLKTVNDANDLCRTFEFSGDKEAAAAATFYIKRVPIKIKEWKLYDTYDTYVREDNIDEILLSYLSAEQKSGVRKNAQRFLKQKQDDWRRYGRF